MATPKIIYYTHKTYADGSHPIMLQVVKNGKAIRKVIARCKPADWLPSKSRVSPRNLEAPRINNDIENALRNYGLSKEHSLQSLWQEQIDNFKINKQVSRYEINKSVLNQLLIYAPNVDFPNVTDSFIYKFVAFLSSPPYSNNKNTIKEKMNVFRSIMRLARKKKMIHDNPFEDLVFSKVKAEKVKLSIDEIRLIIDADLPPQQGLIRDVFLSCIYLRGARVGDVVVLLSKNTKDGRAKYKEMKTGREINIGIGPELQEILNRWAGKSKLGYAFPIMQVPFKSDAFVFKGEIKKAIANINRIMKLIVKNIGIDKNVSSHTARHSFSKLANSVIQNTSITKDLIGHATLAVHEGYISDISDDVIMDGYAKQVLDQLK